MLDGAVLRMKRLFRTADHRSVIIAADHGAIAGPMKGIESPAALTALCAASGVDGMLVHRGFLHAALDAWPGSLGLVLRLTGGFTVLGGRFEEEYLGSAEDALALDAAAAGCTVKFGHPREGSFMREAARLVADCERHGLPVMMETMAWKDGKQVHDAESLALALRAAEELGATFLKSPLPDAPLEDLARQCRAMLRGVQVPVLVLGGEGAGSFEDLLRRVAIALDAGAAGIAIGRQLWGHPGPRSAIEAMVGLVHGGWSLEQAARHAGNGL